MDKLYFEELIKYDYNKKEPKVKNKKKSKRVFKLYYHK